jgi:hypothetical protein
VFANVQSVDPITAWAAREENIDEGWTLTTASVDGPNGYTIVFYDFYGNAFGYVNNVSRATTSTDPAVLAARHHPNATPPSDEATWQDATYVTGTNTRRTPISTYLHGFPVLYGMYSQASMSAGFNRAQVSRYVMPDDGNFWALMADGRYFACSGGASFRATKCNKPRPITKTS